MNGQGGTDTLPISGHKTLEHLTACGHDSKLNVKFRSNEALSPYKKCIIFRQKKNIKGQISNWK